MATRTTHRSSAGKKLYAVRDAEGKFKDIQSYARAHAADLRHTGTASDAAKSAKKAKKTVRKAATKATKKTTKKVGASRKKSAKKKVG